jgi:hypothetical protein
LQFFFVFFPVDIIMSARMSVSKPTALRKSTLALHRMKSKDHEGFEDVRQFVKQVKLNAMSNVIKMKKESPTYIIMICNNLFLTSVFCYTFFDNPKY